MTQPITWGLMAEFSSPEALIAAGKRVYAAGYRKLDAYSPLPVHGLAEAIGFRKTILPLIILIGGLTGCTFGFGLAYYMAWEYPHNVGGRPVYSWPSFIPITFECTILFSAITAVLSLILSNGLPTIYHPVFNVPRFARASQDGFFLTIEASDPQFDVVATEDLLRELNAREVSKVEA